jgi:hypothetical protein
MSNVDPEVVVTKPKMNPLEALNTFIEQIMSWNDLAEKQIKKLKEDEWRYEDRAGGEQLVAKLPSTNGLWTVDFEHCRLLQSSI